MAANNLESRVKVLEYQSVEVLKKLDRIESKQDAAIRQIDTLKYVSQHEFDEYKKDAEKQFVTNESLTPMKTLFWSIISAVILGVIAFGFYLVQNLVGKAP